MTIEGLFELSNEELLSCLESYQQDLLKEVLKANDNDYLKTVDLWLMATPSQTVEFGGNPEKSKSRVFRDKLIEEIEKFVCGTDDTYTEDRKKIAENTDATQQYIIGVLSTAIGAHLGVVGVFIAPIIVIILMSFGKIGLNAWCSLQKEKRIR